MVEPATASAPAPAPTLPGVSRWWRVATVVSLIALSIATATAFSLFEQLKAQVQHLQAQLKDTAQVKYIAILSDANHAPALLVTMTLQDNALQVQRLNGVTEGREDSMQLWALSAGDPARSLGVLQSKGKTLRLSASERDLASATSLAISVEDKGGAPLNQGPRLPYLFTGAVVQKAL